MARQLIFKADSKEFPVNTVKISREKIYGWVEKRILDSTDKECEVAYVDDNTGVIIPKGGTGLGTLSSTGTWITKNELTAVNETGEDATPIPSSFDAPIALQNEASAEEFLDHSISYVYLVEAENVSELIAYIGQKIFKFTYNYREDYEAFTAFLIASEGKLYMLVGNKLDFEYREKENIVVKDETLDDSDISFDMM